MITTVSYRPLLLCGISRFYTPEQRPTIPAQWGLMDPYWGQIDGAVDGAAYGISYGFERDGFHYFCGVEVAPGHDAAQGLTLLDIPAQHCAMFEHSGHIAQFQRSMDAMVAQMDAAQHISPVPGFEIEVYGPRFDGITGQGVVEVLFPISAPPAA